MEESPRAQRQSEITRTALGRSVVEVMAYGCIQEMLKGKLPFTDEGFQALVEHSRVTGLKGKISFQMQGWTQRRMQALFASSGLPMRFIEDANLEGFRKKPSLRNRMLDVGLGPADTSLPMGKSRNDSSAFARTSERMLPMFLKLCATGIVNAILCGSASRKSVLAGTLSAHSKNFVRPVQPRKSSNVLAYFS